MQADCIRQNSAGFEDYFKNQKRDGSFATISYSVCLGALLWLLIFKRILTWPDFFNYTPFTLLLPCSSCEERCTFIVWYIMYICGYMSVLYLSHIVDHEADPGNIC